MTISKRTDDEMSLLIQQAQTIEELAWWDIFQAAPDEYALQLQIHAERLPGGTCFAHKYLPSSLFNRVLKFGVSYPATELMLEELQAWLQKHANATHNIGVDPNAQPALVAEWLRTSGLNIAGGGIARFFYSADQPPDAIKSDLSVREVKADEQGLFGTLVRNAFGFPEGIDTWFGQLAGRANWHVYFACKGITPIGVGAMYVKDGMAWLGVGATLKEYRAQGAQSLLLQRRISDAIKMGAASIHVETGHPAAGDSIGPSYRNILRTGFEVLFVRDQYMRAAAS